MLCATRVCVCVTLWCCGWTLSRLSVWALPPTRASLFVTDGGSDPPTAWKDRSPHNLETFCSAILSIHNNGNGDASRAVGVAKLVGGAQSAISACLDAVLFDYTGVVYHCVWVHDLYTTLQLSASMTYGHHCPRWLVASNYSRCFLLVFYSKRSSKIPRFWARAWDRQTDRRTGISFAQCPHSGCRGAINSLIWKHAQPFS